MVPTAAFASRRRLQRPTVRQIAKAATVSPAPPTTLSTPATRWAKLGSPFGVAPRSKASTLAEMQLQYQSLIMCLLIGRLRSDGCVHRVPAALVHVRADDGERLRVQLPPQGDVADSSPSARDSPAHGGHVDKLPHSTWVTQPGHGGAATRGIPLQAVGFLWGVYAAAMLTLLQLVHCRSLRGSSSAHETCSRSVFNTNSPQYHLYRKGLIADEPLSLSL